MAAVEGEDSTAAAVAGDFMEAVAVADFRVAEGGTAAEAAMVVGAIAAAAGAVIAAGVARTETAPIVEEELMLRGREAGTPIAHRARAVTAQVAILIMEAHVEPTAPRDDPAPRR